MIIITTYEPGSVIRYLFSLCFSSFSFVRCGSKYIRNCRPQHQHRLWIRMSIRIMLVSMQCLLIESMNETLIQAKIDSHEIKLVYRTWLRPDLIEDGEWTISDGMPDCTPEDASNIIIIESTDAHIPPKIFHRYPETIHFEMTNNHLESIQLTDLSGAGWLLKLNISHNEINHLMPHAFELAPKLTEIDLSFNALHDLTENIFTFCSIKYLYLHNNQLTRIDPKWFENLFYLRILTLNNNQIHTIDWSMLNYWPNLNVLHLHSNEIVKIVNDDQLQVPRSMQTLSIHHNPVAHASHPALWLNVELVDVRSTGIEYCTIGNRMSVVKADNNSIREIRLDNLMVADENAIVQLYLANNQLKSLENITHCRHLLYLDVSRNALSHIESNVFVGLTALEHLNLANNRLKHFDISNVQLPNLNFVDVSNNELFALHLGAIISQLNTLRMHGNRFEAADSLSRTKYQIINHQHKCFASNRWDCNEAGIKSNRIVPEQLRETRKLVNDEILSVIYDQFHIMEKNILELVESKFRNIQQRLTRLEEEMIRNTLDMD